MFTFLNSSKYIVILGIISLSLSSCDTNLNIVDENFFKTKPLVFTQNEKFQEIIKAQANSIPSDYHQGLLKKYKPDFYINKLSEGPIDFYQDYIKYGCLETHASDEPDCNVNQEKLNAVKGTPDAIFYHEEPGFKQVAPSAYGSVYQARVTFSDNKERLWTFLKYNFVFRNSGIAAGVTEFEDFAIGFGGDLDDWHQLDHYTAFIVVLNEFEEPVAVMLQQHNYMRTYLINSHRAFMANKTFEVAAAVRSNELYPFTRRNTSYRAANFLNAETVGWLSGVSEYRNVLATYDQIKAEKKVRYELKFLPANDAFYVFTGRLGEHRTMLGRDGPPGAIFNVFPELWPLEIAMPMFYWVEPDPEFAEAYKDYNREDALAPLAVQQERLEKALVAANLLELHY